MIDTTILEEALRVRVEYFNRPAEYDKWYQTILTVDGIDYKVGNEYIDKSKAKAFAKKLCDSIRNLSLANIYADFLEDNGCPQQWTNMLRNFDER